jgi:hypothetical protein
LITKFGNEYKANKEELELRKKQLENNGEIWANEYRDEKDNRAINLRKQSKK